MAHGTGWPTPISNGELLPNALLARNASSTPHWACVISDDPLSVRLEYADRDGFVRRAELQRPWRTATWREATDEGGAPPLVSETCSRSGPSLRSEPSWFEIALLSVPRRRAEYFTQTLRAVRAAFTHQLLHIVTNVSTPPYSQCVTLPRTLVHIVNMAAVQGGIAARGAAMYEYALSVASPSADVLVLEDDLSVRADAGAELQGALREIWALEAASQNGFVLDCYVVAWQGAHPRQAWEHTFAEDDFQCCTQCMYYSRTASQAVREGLRHARQRRPAPYDFVVRDTTRRRAIPVYGTQRSLVQHEGAVSTGLSGTTFLHRSARYRRRSGDHRARASDRPF